MRTIRKITIPLAVIASVLCFSAAKENKPSYPISNVPFTSVKVAPETFWGDRIRQSREVTIPLAFSKCEETDRYTNFKNAAAKMAETARGDNSSNYRPTQFPFDDTDVYKTIEGASYLLQTYPDKKLEAYVIAKDARRTARNVMHRRKPHAPCSLPLAPCHTHR